MNTLNQQSSRQVLSDLFYLALNAVNGQLTVEEQLKQLAIEGDVAIISIGKAATAMMLGAKKQLKDQIQSALIITKEGYADQLLGWPCIEAGHPIPNEQSLDSGTKLLEFISNIPASTKVLALVSGGASALVEVLSDDFNLELLQKMNKWLIASGFSIHEMNKIRQSVSLIKGGKLLNYFSHNEVTQLLISDVKNDDLAIIGSGLFVPSEENNQLLKAPQWLEKYIIKPEPIANVLVNSYIVASNEIACKSIVKKAKEEKYTVNYHGQTLYGDVFELASSLVKVLLSAKSGLHIWGGEPTLVLPDTTGQGGRNQSLALAMAILLENIEGISVLVAATDGSDGPTDDAGAIIDGLTLQRGELLGNAKDYLTAADAGTFLAGSGDLISTGPTGTNVMDIVIALKEPILAAS